VKLLGRMREKAKKLSVFALSLSLCLLALEVAVRFVKPQRLIKEPKGLYEVSPTLGYKLAPHYDGEWNTVEYSTRVRTNSMGQRDYEYGEKAGFRLLGLGDSFTFGAGVGLEDTYLKVLERLLASESGRKIQVINAGVDGYGPEHYLRFLNESGLSLRPDLVTVAFYVANDVHDQIEHKWYVTDGHLYSKKKQSEFKIFNTLSRE